MEIRTTPRMRLADLAAVGELSKSLDYLEYIREALSGPDPVRVRIERIDLRPGLVARIRDAIEQAVDVEAAAIRDRLADLGVAVD